MQVFKTSTQFLNRASDEQLQRMFEDLKRCRHIALAFEAMMQTFNGECGEGVEGYAGPGVMGRLALRIKQLGGQLAYVAMDEPLSMGHRYSGPHACHAAIAAIAQDIAGNVAMVRNVFPDVQVGDIEPFGFTDPQASWLDDLAQSIAAYHATTGQNLAFLHLDMDWHQDWRAELAALAPMLKATGIKFGIIYDGDPGDTDGTTWTRHAEERFAAVEADPALAPIRPSCKPGCAIRRTCYRRRNRAR